MPLPIRMSGMLRLLASLSGLLLLSAGLAWAAPRTAPAATARQGWDPLSPEEHARAHQIALRDSAVRRALSGAPRSAVLRVETYEESKAVVAGGAWPRRAGVFIYDYGQDQLIQVVVNLATGAVDEVLAGPAGQLPPTEAEAARALELTLADPAAGAAVRAAYLAAAGTPLGSPADLAVTALNFQADSVPAGRLPDAAGCGRQRCVQLVLGLDDGGVLALLPVVDLSRERVAGVLGDGGR